MKILNEKTMIDQPNTRKPLKKKLVPFTIWFLFLASFGFAGGGYFLLFLVVPFEQLLVDKGWTQDEIDNLLRYVVYGWVVFGFLISFLYYRFLVRKPARRYLTYGILVFTMINAGVVFYIFTNTNTALISMAKGDIEEVSEQFTFGPYPDEKAMEQLKEEGYDGIITLLSTTLPFEKQLLDDELINGEKSGISVHSFPMLPWVGDNKESLDGIKTLVSQDSSKRYYVHCYLGKHRVDMVRQVIMNEIGIKGNEPLTILPSDFERGNVYSFNNESIIVGPYPTDEEWFILFRRNVQEIISTLDPNSKWFQSEKKIAEEQGITLTSMPLDSSDPDATGVRSIVEYARNLTHPVYIHGFTDSNSLTSLDHMFRYNKAAISIGQFNNELVVGTRFLLSTQIPSFELLKQNGVEMVVSIDSNKSIEKNVLEAGLLYHELSTKSLFLQANELVKKESTVYILGSNQLELEKLRTILYGITYGIRKADFAEMKEVYVVDRDMIIGPNLNEEQWTSLLVEKGVTRILLLHAASLQTAEIVNAQQDLASENGQSFEIVEMNENYLDQIITLFTNHDETTYIIVPPEVQDMVIEGIRGSR
ncbi:hypothetical protein ACLM5H_01010 [Fredinandcohnia humi]